MQRISKEHPILIAHLLVPKDSYYAYELCIPSKKKSGAGGGRAANQSLNLNKVSMIIFYF
jgi:hypothetical protein